MMKLIIILAVLLQLILIFSDQIKKIIKSLNKPKKDINKNLEKANLPKAESDQSDSIILKNKIISVQSVSDTSSPTQANKKESTFESNQEEWEETIEIKPKSFVEEIDLEEESEEYESIFPAGSVLASGVEFEDLSLVNQAIHTGDTLNPKKVAEIIYENENSIWLQKVIESNKKAAEYVSTILNKQLEQIQEYTIGADETSNQEFNINHYL